MTALTLFRRLPAIAAVLAFALVPRVAFAADAFEGYLAGIKGEVEIKRRGAEDWIKAADGMVVKPGDQLNSGIDGRGMLVLKDSKTEIFPLSQFVIGRCVESEKENYTELFLQVGKISAQVNKMEGGKNKFNIVTPTAVAGVRGTRMQVSHFPKMGTDVKIRDGAGVVSPVNARSLPPAVQQILGIAEASKSEEKEEKKEKAKEKKAEKEKDKEQKDEKEKLEKQKDENEQDEKAQIEEEKNIEIAEVTSPEAAVDQFNDWIQAQDALLSPDAPVQDLGLLDEKTFEYVVVVEDGRRAEITDATDPTAVSTPASTQQQDAQSVIAPAGLSGAEQTAISTSTEATTAPESISQSQEQSTLSQVGEVATEISTTLGGIPPSTTLVPPALPDRTGKTNITNK